MTSTTRAIAFLSAAAFLGAALLISFHKLPEFGHYRGPYGDVINARALPQRHTPQSVAAITFDYRGFDTLGEEFILFTAVTGVLLLMRRQRTEEEEEPRDEAVDRHVPEPNDAVRTFGAVLFLINVLTGVYIVIHGHLTPGGGFQGGVVLASAFFYVYLSCEYDRFKAYMNEGALEMVEGTGASGFVVVGLLGLLSGAAFLTNVLPLGGAGKLLSAGTLPLLNVTVGAEVCTAFLLIIASFLRQALTIRKREEE